MAETIGFIGLGKLGAPASKRLHEAGHRLALFDRDKALAARLAAEYRAETPATLRGCGVIVTALPDGARVREALQHADLAPGTLVIDMGSCDPGSTRELGKSLAARRVHMVDAPVSGGVRAAAQGELVFMVGGAPDDVARARPFLLAMGTRVFELGPLGAGHALKCLNNYIAAAGYAAACEALLAGKRYGLDPQAMLDAINVSSGRSYNTEGKFAQHVLTRSWGSGFSLGHMAKDVRIAQSLAKATGTPFLLGNLCEALWADAASAIGEEADHTEYVRALEEATGTQLAQEIGVRVDLPPASTAGDRGSKNRL
jgi:3-hydroxyisobutyrate dehydrogenase